jgi:predicted nucleotidyltransferase
MVDITDKLMTRVSPQTQGKIMTEEAIAAIVQTIATRINPQQILLFGSYACGTPTEDSD